MTIDEAISHAMDKYRECRNTNSQCSLDHYQLATWLSELEMVKEENVHLKRLAKMYARLIPILVIVQSSAIMALIYRVLKLKGVI